MSIRSIRLSPNIEIKILATAMLLFLAGIYLSLRDEPDLFNEFDWYDAAVVVLVGVPLTVMINGLEFMCCARMVGRKFSIFRSLEITIVGSAANMLPVPGASIVRILALKSTGLSLIKSTGINMLLALIWIGISFLYAGMTLLHFVDGLIAWGVIGTGGLALLSSFWVVSYNHIHSMTYLYVVVLKFVLVLVDAARIYFCFQALGLDVLFLQASVFVVSGVMGSAVSVVPAGLGVRELVSAVLAPLIGVAASAGFLSATLNRIAGLSTLLPIAGLLILFKKEKQREAF
ncbi:flippase-like domain-containing protein [Vibrio sp. Isolate33]|uniref:lysylphosphatidylglycerol synthase domain-containing protein n=1 Tax=Vibrio sp. Isolate33 TaxID=2908539 RepID=UPI001EFD7E56|nr:lysylphosphatidylglycerol synthase domain-containing protein [Vibrio sp. Isolate33]MCG9545948.1 flippase-like domain-containing protein [Vibrio sp. Isolate33]